MSSEVLDPMELLTNKGDRQLPFLNKVWNPTACAALGFTAAMITNWGFRKPIFAGIQKHIAYAAIGGGFGFYIDGKRNEYLAKRDAVYRHYIELHPDDFPTKPRVKYADVLEVWAPIR